jgi:hypothetical protein
MCVVHLIIQNAVEDDTYRAGVRPSLGNGIRDKVVDYALFASEED